MILTQDTELKNVASLAQSEYIVIKGPAFEEPVTHVHHLRHKSGDVVFKLFLSGDKVNRLELKRSELVDNDALFHAIRLVVD